MVLTWFTVKLAAVVVAVWPPPQESVNTARYLFPLRDTVGAVTVSVVLVAPGMSFHVVPPSVLTCHCTVGGESPLAAATKVASWPETTI